MSSGTAGETMFVKILESMGFGHQAKTIGKKRLLEAVEEIRPGRIKNVAERRLAVGKPTNWNITSPELILDWVYGLDCVVDVDGNGRLFAMDFTVNPEEISKKADKLRRFSALWKAVGIEKVAVVLAVPPSKEFGLALLTNEQEEKIKDDLYEVIFLMDESSIEVSKHIVNW